MEVLINRPDNEPNIMEALVNTLGSKHKEIGKERLLNQLDIICLEFANENGYCFAKDGERFVFTHHSLDERDFLRK
jgi:hypothetical protein